MDQYEIRDLTLGEADLAAKFFHEQWRPQHIFFRNRDVLLWQHYENPYARRFSDGLTFRAAFKGSGLVGTFAYMPFVFNRYGERQFGCYLSAFWVHPDHRRGPLALRLLFSLQQQESFQAYFGGINTPVAEQIYERMSWVVVRNMPRLVCVIDRERLRALFQRSPVPDVLQRIACANSTPTRLETKPGLEIASLDSFDSLKQLGWDEFYWQKIAQGQMGPAREVAHLNWRYGKIPLFKYDALVAKQEGKVAGLLVFRVERIRDPEQRIIRLVDAAAEVDAFSGLVGTLIEIASDKGATLIDFFCTHQQYISQLAQCGFVSACDDSGDQYWLPYLFQPLDQTRLTLNASWWIRNMDLHTASARADMCIMKGDYEFDRPN